MIFQLVLAIANSKKLDISFFDKMYHKNKEIVMYSIYPRTMSVAQQ